MKKLIIGFSLILMLCFSACNIAGNEDYRNIASDTCDCANTSSDSLSTEMRDLIIAMSESKDSQKLFNEFASKNPLDAIKFNSFLLKFQPEMQKCMENSKGKYEKLYTTDSEEEVNKKTLNAMKSIEKCKLLNAMIKLNEVQKK